MTSISSALLIDDNELDTMLFERILRRGGQIDELKAFHSAEDALGHIDTLNSAAGPLIFLDLYMPRMNGFEFLAELKYRKFDAGCRVVLMLTMPLSAQQRELANEFRGLIVGTLNKPLTSKTLDSLLETIENNEWTAESAGTVETAETTVTD